MSLTRKTLEKEFQKWLITKKHIRIKNRNLIILDSETRLLKPMFILSRGNPLERNYFPEIFGRIDLLFRYRNKNYAGEIKYMPFGTENFWSALKCLGYTSYLNWQRDYRGKNKYFPAILMPIKAIKLEHRMLAGQLHILLLGINKIKNKWEVEDITNKIGF